MFWFDFFPTYLVRYSFIILLRYQLPENCQFFKHFDINSTFSDYKSLYEARPTASQSGRL